MKAWAIQNPNGTLRPGSVGDSRTEAWASTVGGKQYAGSWRPFLARMRRAGFRCVRVTVTPTGARKGGGR